VRAPKPDFSPPMTDARPSRRRADLPTLLGVAAAYALMSWLVIHYFSQNGGASIFFLPSGIALAALLIGGRRYFWAVFFGSLLGELLSGDALWVGAMKAGGAAVGALCGAWLIRRNPRFDVRLTSVQDLFMLGTGGVLSAAVSSFIGATSLLLSGAVSWDGYFSSMNDWWLGDTLGIALMAPLILVWWPTSQNRQVNFSTRFLAELATLFALTMLAAGIIFLDWGHQTKVAWLHTWINSLSQDYWMYAYLTWAAVRFGARGTSAMVLMVSTFGILGIVQNVGFFSEHESLALINYWFHTVILSFVGMTLAIYIAASKRTTESLLESKGQADQELHNYLQALDHHAIVSVTDVQGRILSINEKFCETSGYARDELLGENHRILNSGLHPQEYFRDMYRSLAAGNVWHGEFRNRTKSGRLYWVKATITPFMDEHGKPARYVAIRTEVTTQKMTESILQENTRELQLAYQKLSADHRELLELKDQSVKIQRQLLQAEKMSSIGQLAAGVAHEINNPIGFVNSNLGTLGNYVGELMRLAELGAATPAGQALQAEIDLDYLRTDLPNLLSESRDGLERVRRIVADLKDFSHVGEVEWQYADLLAGLESTLNVVWHELKYKVQIMRELAPLPPVRCVPAQINQVFMNLLVNAAQAIAEQGTITLRSGHDGTQVWIEIADTGCGMDEATRQRLFDPFFTTKQVGVGTGLGMSITWDIVHKHEGTIEVSSEPGSGSCFRLQLPIAGPAPKEIVT
jgi:PAS domain S-box-containing protein